MNYIIFQTDSLTQEMLDSINQGEVTQPTTIYIVEPNLDQGQAGVKSAYSYITTSENFPNGFGSYKKLNETTFNELVTRLKSGQTIQNKVESKSPELNSPFAAKEIDGKKLFKRVHGISASVQNVPDTIDFNVPYDQCKITAIEIIGGNIGDRVNLKVTDTPVGTISGFPNVVLNQFGFDVAISKDYYEHSSSYDADLIKDMKIRIEYDAIDELLPKTVYFNIILHEVK